MMDESNTQQLEIRHFEVKRRKSSTPKGFDSKAQGRERSERTLGQHRTQIFNPEGVTQP